MNIKVTNYEKIISKQHYIFKQLREFFHEGRKSWTIFLQSRWSIDNDNPKWFWFVWQVYRHVLKRWKQLWMEEIDVNRIVVCLLSTSQIVSWCVCTRREHWQGLLVELTLWAHSALNSSVIKLLGWRSIPGSSGIDWQGVMDHKNQFSTVINFIYTDIMYTLAATGKVYGLFIEKGAWHPIHVWINIWQ